MILVFFCPNCLSLSYIWKLIKIDDELHISYDLEETQTGLMAPGFRYFCIINGSENLVKLIERTIRSEYDQFPDRPIYLVGESVGGCLALTVAARVPHIDLVLVLANPATSFGKSQLQPLVPILKITPDVIRPGLPYIMSLMTGVPSRMLTSTAKKGLPSQQTITDLSNAVASLFSYLSGEEYKLFWPEQSEFVRMAARFGAMVIPFGVVGEDDYAQLVLDYDDQMKIPFMKDYVKQTTGDSIKLREELRSRERAQQVYTEVKEEVEKCLNYCKTKRENDPYRNILSRLMYQATHGLESQAPTFDLD
ncbi:hypothetical protein L1987_52299 [Smallanthus sonchifolius]|uniref:Uncharacterized protein n=1 Tax=Smallanthus sonchifolius TaxID=185202 RepID=A0ACB9ETX7_9ASTR|nr:hypothetical protein L1987_52299 [Smallanthus sonchifolius]